MKQLVFPFLAIILLLSCSNPDPSLKYQSYVDKYNGAVYMGTNVTADVSGVSILPDGIGTAEDREHDLYHQFAVWDGGSEWRAESWINSSNGKGGINVYFPLSCIETEEFPPYTRETQASFCGSLVSWAQEATFQIQDNGSFQWGETIAEEDQYDLAKTIMGKLKVLSLDEKQIEVTIEDYPVFDQASKQVSLIPVSIHFERKKN